MLRSCLENKGSADNAEVLLRESLSFDKTAYPDNKTSNVANNCHDCTVAEDIMHVFFKSV